MKRGIGFGKIGLNIGQMKLGDKEEKSKDDSKKGSEAGFGSFGSFNNKEKDRNEITNLVNEEEKTEESDFVDDVNPDIAKVMGFSGFSSTTHKKGTDKLTPKTFEASTKSRAEELKALATAKKIIAESTGGAGGAADLSYSFIQISKSKLSSRTDLANFEAVRLVRDLAKKENSKALAQLASRMSSAMRLNSGSADPFAKVKGLIQDMLEKLESDAEADATQQAYCEKEMAESKAKEEEMTTDIEKLSTKIDSMSAKSKQLKEEVAALQKSLAELAKLQAEMDKMRAEEKATYETNKPEMDEGLEGIKMALKVLRDYYAKDDKAHAAAEGSSTGIISLLEVVESDFSKGIAEMVTTEESAAALYDSETKENDIERATKEKDVEYKTKESVGLDKSVAEASSDRAGVQTELDAVVEYMKKLDDMCIAKPDTYAERTRRRAAEIAGLKEALTILEGEAVLLQKTRKSLRGVAAHKA